MTDVRRHASDFPQKFAEHTVSYTRLGHPEGQLKTACLLTWVDDLDASMFASLTDQLGPLLVPRILLGGAACSADVHPVHHSGPNDALV